MGSNSMNGICGNNLRLRVEARFQRLRFDYERNPGALPQARIEVAPLALSRKTAGGAKIVAQAGLRSRPRR